MKRSNSKNSGWKAVADLGTNTFQLLIAKLETGKLHTVLRKKIGVKIGKGGMEKKEILPDAVERSIAALHEFSIELDKFGLSPSDCITLATSAFRNAENKEKVVEIIRKETGFAIQIIPGEEEANLIFKGVLASGAIEETPSNLIVDIGGGSVEFILCNGKKQQWKKSFEVGGLRLLEKFHKEDPISQLEITKLKNYLDLELKELWDIINIWKPEVLVGCSGSFDTLVEMQYADLGQALPDVEANSNYTLDPIHFQNLKNKLVFSSFEERLKMPGMILLRSEMMVVAVILIDHLIGKMSDPQIRTSTFAMKEGCLYSNYDPRN